MARIDITGTEELAAALRDAGGLDSETEAELLDAAGEILTDELQKATRESGFETAHYAQHIKRRAGIRRTKVGDPYVSVGVTGNNVHGTRRALVLFVLNYGRSKKRGKIDGTLFWTNAAKKAEKLATERVEAILTKKMQERGLL